MTDDVIQEVKNAMNAFETFKTDLAPKLEKLDAFDAAKFNKIQEQIGKAIEESQAEQGRVKALEDQNKAQQDQVKALETELTQVKTVLNRAPAGGPAAEAKELAALRVKAFNAFVRSDANEHFDQFIKREAAVNPEYKALSVGSDVSGGYLVMPELGGMIQTKVFESSPIRQLATVTTVGATDSYEVIVDFDEAGAGWVGETATRSETTTPTLGKVSIPVNEIYAKPKATQKLLDDATMDMEAWLAQKVADQFARKEATAFVSGSGVVQPKGLLSYDSGTTLSSSQIEQVNLGSTTEFTYAGLVNLQNALKEAYQPNASWLYRRASNALIMKVVDGEGRPIFNMMYDKNVGLQPTLMGKDVYFAADVPAVASAALSLIYGDIKRAYQIVDRQGIRILRDPYSSKPYVEFYTTKRVGGGVVNFEAAKIGKSSV